MSDVESQPTRARRSVWIAAARHTVRVTPLFLIMTAVPVAIGGPTTWTVLGLVAMLLVTVAVSLMWFFIMALLFWVANVRKFPKRPVDSRDE